MNTKIDCMINDFLSIIPLQDDLDGNRLRSLLDDVRSIYQLDCVFVFENLTFRNDFVYSYYSVEHGCANKLGTIVQFTDAEYADRLQMYDDENLYMCYEKNRNTGVLESKMRYGFITGETYYGSVGFVCFHNRDWSLEEREALNLHDCVQESVELFTANAAAKKLGFVIHNQIDDKCVILGDSVRLSQIFNNLISNAIKYTDHGKVTIDAYLSQENDQLLFCCEDTGIGMDADFLAHLCDPYMRDEKEVHHQSGTGLGMSITNNLVRLMNGSMDVKSQKSKGTAIIVTIPITLSSADTEEPDDETIVERELAGRRILVTDDNELNREIAVELISSLGIIVETATDGANAIKQLLEHSPGYYDLILMDIQMPVMDGYEATKIIRSLECRQLSEIPIIAMTANAYLQDIEETKKAGMNAHLCKPIDLKTLVKLMYKYIL